MSSLDSISYTGLIWAVVIVIAGSIGLQLLVRHMKRRADDGDPRTDTGKEKRTRTLGRMVMTAGQVVLWTVAILTALQSFGINTTPILAASGVIGVAVGLGLQSFAKDFVSGVIIFVENQYAEGDRVKIGAFEGTVEQMTIRSTVLKDDDGNLIFLSNGDVKGVMNYSLSGLSRKD
ncbi:mechanosensitive ion channel family protein [Patescibacteria group bacterium]